MLGSVQSSPLPTTAFAGPTTAAGLDAVGSAKLPVSPSGIRTTATIEANLGSPPVTQRAMAAMNFGEKWISTISQVADLTDINIGGALRFAHADVRHLARDLKHDAPDARITRDTDRLINDWVANAPQVFGAIRHGLFRNAEQDIAALGPQLARGGVTSPQIQGALRNLASTLAQVDSLMASHPPGLSSRDPFGQFQSMVNRAEAGLFQAMQADASAHPEHGQALTAAADKVNGAVRQLGQGLMFSTVLAHELFNDLEALPWLPQPAANAPNNGAAPAAPAAP